MTKEPTGLPTVTRRRRKLATDNTKVDISYNSLLSMHLRECQVKNLATVTIDGYRTASRYFLDFAGCNLLCSELTKDLVNRYSLNLQEVVKPQTVNSYLSKVSPTILFGIRNGYIPHRIEFT